MNRNGIRFSSDIDIFQDRKERVSAAAQADASTLEQGGYGVAWKRQEPSFMSARIEKDQAYTRLEWVADSDYRFFPTVRDELFGYVLHPVDLALNKAMAAVGRREVRDVVDLVAIHRTILPLGAIVWAAVEKSPGFTPEGLIEEIRRNSNYPRIEWEELSGSEPIDPKVIVPQLRQALDDAENFVSKMPTAKGGLLFLKAGKVVQPDPERLAEYETHAGQRRGHWPSSLEISGAMLERYQAG